ncbi:MAG: hypothetical protein J4428_02930 [Candidatus Aenigmarchaeota archaeon]|nr:hypothetical protein [Candidatus Aenigmarchaeota archaeon]
MFHFNSQIKGEGNHFLDLFLPHIYDATSISDFLREREGVKITGYDRMIGGFLLPLILGKPIVLGGAWINLHNVRYYKGGDDSHVYLDDNIQRVSVKVYDLKDHRRCMLREGIAEGDKIQRASMVYYSASVLLVLSDMTKNLYRPTRQRVRFDPVLRPVTT